MGGNFEMRNKKDHFLKAGSINKTAVVALTLLFILTAFTTVSIADEPTSSKIETRNIVFSAPEVTTDNEGYINIQVEGAPNQRLAPGCPMLPQYIEIIGLPLDASDITVDFSHSSLESLQVSGPLAPTPEAVVLSDLEDPAISQLYSTMASLFEKTQPKVRSDEEYSESQTLVNPLGDIFSYEIDAGINEEGQRMIFVIARIMPCTITTEGLSYFTSGELTVHYESTPSLSLAGDTSYDLLILAPSGYISELQPLVAHKEDMGLKTKLVSLDDIYNEVYFEKSEEFSRDIQEEIKYFMYQAVNEWDVQYVMAVGGWRSLLGFNRPAIQFPVRYSHNVDGEPGYIAEQYYSCFQQYDEDLEKVVYDSWDSNGNDRFAEWDIHGWDKYEPSPDVYFGRLACRSKVEVRTMVNKIITYETETFGAEWFNEVLSVTGDGFQDQSFFTDTTVEWNISTVPNGDYIIYAQSESLRVSDLFGPVDQVKVTVDHGATSRLTFEETDHEKIEPLSEEQDFVYPGKPVAEIVVPSTGDILGNTDVYFIPSEAYLGERWAVADYNKTTEILKIRTKSYDPRPHEFSGQGNPLITEDDLAGFVEGKGSHTYLRVWINNSEGDTVLGPVTKASDNYWEGEIEANQTLHYLGDDFNPTRIWASMGNWKDMNDVINAFSEGYGLAYINGHSSCISYGDHFPGIPGGRDDGQVNGLAAINLRFGLERYAAEEGEPLFPLDHLTNGDKQPVFLYSGCHSGQFDTSFASLFMDPYNVLFGDRYGTWVPEGVAWWMTRLPQGGSIATIGNTGLGSGYIGYNILRGLTGWLFPTFFYYYNIVGLDHVGQAHTQTLTTYHIKDNAIMNQGVRKHFEQWNLLGDPSLKIGGYDPDEDTGSLSDQIESFRVSKKEVQEISTFDPTQYIRPSKSLDYVEFKVTSNSGDDISPESLLSADEKFLTGYSYNAPEGGDIHPGFAMSEGGGYWDEIIYANPLNAGSTSLTEYTLDDEEYFVGSLMFDASTFGAIFMDDITNPGSWSATQYFFSSGVINTIGEYGMTVTGYGDEEDFGGMWSANWDGSLSTLFMFTEDAYVHGLSYIPEHFTGDVDETTGYHYWACEVQDSSMGLLMTATPPDYYDYYTLGGFNNPDVDADLGQTYYVYTTGEEVHCRKSMDNGDSWQTTVITVNGQSPDVVIEDENLVVCYYIRGQQIYKAESTNQGDTWVEVGTISDVMVDDTYFSPFVIDTDAVVYAKDDGDLYANIFLETHGAVIPEISLDASGRTAFASVINSGTAYLQNATISIGIEGDSPLGEWFGGTPLLLQVFKGKVLRNGYNSKNVWLAPRDTEGISTSAMFGIGHILVNVQVVDDGEVIAEASEDGFLLGGRLFLYHGEE